MKRILFVIVAIALSFPVVSQQLQEKYNAHELFNPQFLSEPGTAYRSGSGKPGPNYWQNSADYAIKASLDETSEVITAEEEITYTNQSPDPLDFVWLQLDQNKFTQDSKGSLTTVAGGSRFGREE